MCPFAVPELPFHVMKRALWSDKRCPFARH